MIVCRGINDRQRPPLYRFDGNLTSASYKDEILRSLVIMVLRAIWGNAVIMDINAPYHHAGIANNLNLAQNVTSINLQLQSKAQTPLRMRGTSWKGD